MTMKNTFGLRIPSLGEIVQDPEVRRYIEKTLQSVLTTIGASLPSALTQRVLTSAKELPLERYEQEGHEGLHDIPGLIARHLVGRARLAYEQISPYLQGGTLLDLGCGDGKIGHLAAEEGRKVMLADVYKHPNIDETGLEFHCFGQGEAVPLDDATVDTTLLLTVLHHSDNPVQTLREAQRVTKPGGNIIVIESVYGIRDNSPFGKLTEEQLRRVNIFFDHFYNRVLHYSPDPKSKVNVPYNFNTPEGWRTIFAQQGLDQMAYVLLGIDQPVVPEYHTLHVLKV